MKKSLLTLVCIAISSGLFSAFAETKNFDLKKPINAIEASAGVQVIYKPTTGSTAKVTINGDAKRIEHVDVKISGKTLEISPKSRKFGGGNINLHGVTITVTAPILSSIEASAGASVKCTSSISSTNKKIDIEASSGSKISFSNISCRELDIEASSGASISVGNVNASRIDYEASSGASVSSGVIRTERLDCEASSSGSIKIASGQATRGNFEASSAGKINAQSVKLHHSSVDKSSGGSVRISN